MAAKLEIILEDKSSAAAPASPGTPVPIQPAPSGSPAGKPPSEVGGKKVDKQSPAGKPPSEVGGKKVDKQSPAANEVIGLAKNVADSLGFGGIAGAALRLVSAFRNLDSQIENSRAIAASRDAKAEAERNAALIAKQQPSGIPLPKPPPAAKPPQNDVDKLLPPQSGAVPESGPMAPYVMPPPVIPKTPTGTAVSAAGAGSNAAAITVGSGAAASGAGGASASGAMAAAATAVATAGVVVAAVAVVAAPFVALGYVVKTTVEGIKSLTDELETYSGAVAVAAGQSQLREELASIRRGQTIGPDLARVENLRSRAQDEAARIMDGFYSAILKMLVRNEHKIESAINILSKVADNSGVITEGMLKGLDFYTDLVPVFAANKFAFQQALKLLGNIDENTKDKEPDDDGWTDEWLKQFGQPALNGVGRPMGGKP